MTLVEVRSGYRSLRWTKLAPRYGLSAYEMALSPPGGDSYLYRIRIQTGDTSVLQVWKGEGRRPGESNGLQAEGKLLVLSCALRRTRVTQNPSIVSYRTGDRQVFQRPGITFPPETGMYAPVMYEAKSDARNSTALATSWSVPRRRKGIDAS